MKRMYPAVAFLAIAVVFSAVEAAWAQYPMSQRQRYRPSRPTLSPYLDLLRTDSGELPNYHTFVRPKQQYRRTMQQQAAVNRRQAAGMRALGGQVSQMQRTAGIRPTGTGSGFMNYSHYYPMRGSFGGR